jgi:hypothetical protein
MFQPARSGCVGWDVDEIGRLEASEATYSPAVTLGLDFQRSGVEESVEASLIGRAAMSGVNAAGSEAGANPQHHKEIPAARLGRSLALPEP